MALSILQDVPLKDYSTFKIGGPARYFSSPKDEDELQEALDFAIQKRLPVFVIGRGSNLLISDKGFDGLVLRVGIQNMSSEESGDIIKMRLGAGIPLTKLALDLAKEGLGGLEWAAGIPATLGGAVVNNAGAQGRDMAGLLESVEALVMDFDPENKALAHFDIRKLQKDECGFAYRTSIFKENKKYIVLYATLSFRKGDIETIRETTSKNIENRSHKQPLEYPNIGSIFKNPSLSQTEQDRLVKDYPDSQNILKDGTVPAGWLIEKAGLKGRRIGGAMVSEKHANFIVNAGGATAEDVMILISLVKEKVRVESGIQLHEEIEFVGL